MELKWSAFIRAMEVEGFLLFYSAPQIAYYVPAEAVGREEWGQIVQWVEGAGLTVQVK